jgi:nucleoside-diphosphate-sugar epimerase
MAKAGRWDDFEAVTVRGTEELLKAACRQQVKQFVHVSTVAIYGVHDQETVTEAFPLDTHTPKRGYYTRSKVESEQLVWRYAQQDGLPVTILRPGILYGLGKPPFIARLRVPLGRTLLAVIARSDQLLPLTFVDNMAAAISLALGREQAIGNAYNIVDSETIRQGRYLELLREYGLLQTRTILLSPTLFLPWIAVGEWVCHRLGVVPPVSRHQLERACVSVRYDTTRARKDLEWTPRVGLVDALNAMRDIQG